MIDKTYNFHKIERGIQDLAAEHYDDLYERLPFYVYRRKRIVSRVKEVYGELTKLNQPRILDVGCGTASLLKELEKQGFRSLFSRSF